MTGIKMPIITKQNQNSSLLTLGNPLYITAEEHSDRNAWRLGVFNIRNVNFAANKAKGEDGFKGGGGGLGAGGGISIVAGTAKLENVVFQNLEAIGGKGGSGASGGSDADGRSGNLAWNGSRGEAGGFGGGRGSFSGSYPDESVNSFNL